MFKVNSKYITIFSQVIIIIVSIISTPSTSKIKSSELDVSSFRPEHIYDSTLMEIGLIY